MQQYQPIGNAQTNLFSSTYFNSIKKRLRNKVLPYHKNRHIFVVDILKTIDTIRQLNKLN